MKNEGTWTFFYAAVVAAVASTPKYEYFVRYTRTQQQKNGTIGAESLTIHMRCKWKIILYATRIATVSPGFTYALSWYDRGTPSSHEYEYGIMIMTAVYQGVVDLLLSVTLVHWPRAVWMHRLDFKTMDAMSMNVFW